MLAFWLTVKSWTRGTEKQTLPLAGYKHATIVYSSLYENSFSQTDSETLLINSLMFNVNKAETKVKES